MARIIGFFFFLAVLAGCSDQSGGDKTGQPESEAGREIIDDARSEAEQEAKRLAAAQAEKARQAPIVSEEGRAYLHINAQKSGVEVLESGLQFEMLEQGEGRSPGPRDTVMTHYHGTFTNGEVFDSSVERGQPAEFPVNRVIAGWTEALQMMKEGDVWRLVIPPHLAYGERGAGDVIPPNAVLIFEVELIEVKD